MPYVHIYIHSSDVFFKTKFVFFPSTSSIEQEMYTPVIRTCLSFPFLSIVLHSVFLWLLKISVIHSFKMWCNCRICLKIKTNYNWERESENKRKIECIGQSNALQIDKIFYKSIRFCVEQLKLYDFLIGVMRFPLWSRCCDCNILTFFSLLRKS